MGSLHVNLNDHLQNVKHPQHDGHSLVAHERLLLRSQARSQSDDQDHRWTPYIAFAATIGFIAAFVFLCFSTPMVQGMSL